MPILFHSAYPGSLNKSTLCPANFAIMAFVGSSAIVASAGDGSSGQPSFGSQASHHPTDDAKLETASQPGVLVRCCFDCGPPRPSQEMVNTGTKVSARWMCSPCNGARKAIEWGARSNEKLKQFMVTLKRDDPELWKQKVRAARIRAPGEEHGLDSAASRRNFICSLTVSFEQRLLLQEKQKRKLMTPSQYFAFLKYKEGVQVDTPEAKAAWWKAALDNPDVHKEGTGDDTRILVNCGIIMAGIRERVMSTKVSHEKAIESAHQLQQGLAKMASVGTGVTALSGSAMGPLSDAFRTGAAVCTSSDEAMPTSSWALPSAPPPAGSIVAPEEFSPFGTDTGGHKRGLQAFMSDPANPDTGRKGKKGRRQETFAAGALHDSVEAARAQVKRIQVKYGQTRVNLAKELKRLKVKRPEAVTPEMNAAADRYEELLGSVNKQSSDISSWTVSTSDAAAVALTECETELETLARSLTDDLATIKAQLKEQRSVTMRRIRMETTHRERVIKPYLSARTPGNVARWLFQVGAFGPNAAMADIEQPAAGVGQPWTYRVKWNVARGAFNADLFSIWTPDMDDIAADLRKLEAAYNNRLDTAVKELLNFLSREETKPGGSLDGVMRLAAKGRPQDTVESLAWVPNAWSTAAMPPEALRTFGAPWLFVGKPGTIRSGTGGWPLPGMGQFISVISGSVILIVFDYKACLERGASINSAVKWLFDQNLNMLTTFASNAFQAATLPTKATAWVPYGHAVILINRSEVLAPSFVLGTPYLSATLGKKCPLIGQMATYNIQNIESAANRKMKPWDTLGAEFKEWATTLIEDDSEVEASISLEPATLALQDIDIEHEESQCSQL